MKRRTAKNETKFKVVVHIDDDLYIYTGHVCKRKYENLISICDLLGILKKYFNG